MTVEHENSQHTNKENQGKSKETVNKEKGKKDIMQVQRFQLKTNIGYGTNTLSFECERPVDKTFKISEPFHALFKQEIFISDDGNQFCYYLGQ